MTFRLVRSPFSSRSCFSAPLMPSLQDPSTSIFPSFISPSFLASQGSRFASRSSYPAFASLLLLQFRIFPYRVVTTPCRFYLFAIPSVLSRPSMCRKRCRRVCARALTPRPLTLSGANSFEAHSFSAAHICASIIKLSLSWKSKPCAKCADYLSVTAIFPSLGCVRLVCDSFLAALSTSTGYCFRPGHVPAPEHRPSQHNSLVVFKRGHECRGALISRHISPSRRRHFLVLAFGLFVCVCVPERESPCAPFAPGRRPSRLAPSVRRLRPRHPFLDPIAALRRLLASRQELDVPPTD